jgi:hypothetical protein
MQIEASLCNSSNFWELKNIVPSVVLKCTERRAERGEERDAVDVPSYASLKSKHVQANAETSRM